MNKENYINNILKANLLLSDYTLSYGDTNEQRVFFYLLDKYILKLDNPILTTLFDKVATTNNEEEKDLYIEILFDTIEDIKKEVA